MGAIANGMALSKLRTFTATFFNFNDYMKPSVRLSAIMEIPVIYIYTHDSISLGEDGPTHQPIEQLAQLRAMPGLVLLRPADANEVVEAWKVIMQLAARARGVVLCRQAVPTFDRTKYGSAAGVAKGAYVLADAPNGKPEVILIGTAAKSHSASNAYEKLKAEGIQARVVSMPSWDLFERQDEAYKDSVLPPRLRRESPWKKRPSSDGNAMSALKGRIIGMRTFGASAPAKDLQKKFGFTTDAVMRRGPRPDIRVTIESTGQNRSIYTSRARRPRSPNQVYGEVIMNPVDTVETAKSTNPLKDLRQYGQSVWLDYIRRNLLTSGDLKKLIDDDGLMGMTSNPAIFEKAIAAGTDYDDFLALPGFAKPTSMPRDATSYWRSATFRTQPTFCGPSTSPPNGATAMSASKFPLISRTIPTGRSPRRVGCGKRSAARM